MTRWAAFLRGINLGNRRLGMAELRKRLEGLGLESLATYQASGNVVFDREGSLGPALEERLEEHLQDELGYEVDTFVRALERVADVAERSEAEAPGDGFKTHVVFLKGLPEGAVVEALGELETPDDRFVALEREVLWHRRGGMSKAPISPGELEKALGGTYTIRTAGTVRRIARKFRQP